MLRPRSLYVWSLIRSRYLFGRKLRARLAQALLPRSGNEAMYARQNTYSFFRMWSQSKRLLSFNFGLAHHTAQASRGYVLPQNFTLRGKTLINHCNG